MAIYRHRISGGGGRDCDAAAATGVDIINGTCRFGRLLVDYRTKIEGLAKTSVFKVLRFFAYYRFSTK